MEEALGAQGLGTIDSVVIVAPRVPPGLCLGAHRFVWGRAHKVPMRGIGGEQTPDRLLCLTLIPILPW